MRDKDSKKYRKKSEKGAKYAPRTFFFPHDDPHWNHVYHVNFAGLAPWSYGLYSSNAGYGHGVNVGRR